MPPLEETERNVGAGRCPVCGSGGAEVFLQWRGLPAFQNVVFATADSARAIARGDVVLACCSHCAFIFNLAYRPLEYARGYDNQQSESPRFRAHLDAMARLAAERLDLAGKRLVEVGCGDGSFLRRLLQLSPQARGVGFDPAYVGPPDSLDGRARFEARMLDELQANEWGDVIVCRHVLGHIREPVDFLRSLGRAGGGRKGTKVFIEIQCAGWILAHRSIWDICFEQCSYFSPAATRTAMAVSGLRVTDLHHVFDGQYFWLEALVDDPDPEPLCDSAAIMASARSFGKHDARIRADRSRDVEAAAPTGAAVWGASTKGVLFAHFTDPEAKHLRFAIDLKSGQTGQVHGGDGPADCFAASAYLRGCEHDFSHEPGVPRRGRGALA